MTHPTLLLNPGPVTLTTRVRSALAREDQCHREPEFANLILDIKKRLTEIYPEAINSYDAVLVNGSGTCAVEAMLATLLPAKSTTLVITNGVYGERMTRMIQLHDKPMRRLQFGWSDPIDLVRVEEELTGEEKITHMVAVHNETTTGRLNDIDKLAALGQKYNIPLLLDAVSSFGGEALDFSAQSLLAVAATANKCLHGVPGISFVMVQKSAFATAESHARSLYLDLLGYYKEQQQGYSPFTSPVHACFALHEAILELEDGGGWQKRHAHYSRLSSWLRRELSQLGIKTWLKEDEYSSMISSFCIPDGITYKILHQACRQAGFVIYAGQGELKKSIFRIANMGNLRDEDMARLITVFQKILQP
ncbi:MAG: 2-aminoethylphosphonate aminotransferase [Magnetococcales bacterium]|nr:2-aminoethylphosphonate aminotransferase [Magnetococcales bacterium]